MDDSTVSGLRNLGNTCYLNAALQALASCTTLMNQIDGALRQLDAAAKPVPLAAALLDCLQVLQPQAGSCSAPPRTVVPRRLVDAFRSRLMPGVLEAGEEQDAAEAVEELCRLAGEELQAALASSVQQQLAVQASLAAILGGPSRLGAAHQGGPDSTRTDASNSASAAAGSRPASHARSSGTAKSSSAGRKVDSDGTCSTTINTGKVPAGSGSSTQAAPAAAAALPPPASDPVLASWRDLALLPLQGSNAHELQCLRCRHQATVHVVPFWVLSLSIPPAPGRTLLGNVPAAAGANLGASLASFYGPEALQGWHCMRCSLDASLKAADPSPAPSAAAQADAGRQEAGQLSEAPAAAEAEGGTEAAANPEAQAAVGRLPPELRRLQEALAAGRTLVDSEAYREMLGEAGVEWVPRPSPAAKRIVAAQLPRVLCLQLRRAFWTEQGQQVKMSGHVAFPLRLTLPPSLVPRLWRAPLSQRGGQLHGAAGDERSLLPPPPPVYLLRAVVVHHGGAAGGGHYTVLRCLHASTWPAAWVRASDEVVQPAGLAEVLQAEACLLLYEQA